LFLFQFERREAGFVITGYNNSPTPDGKLRFCTGMQFNSLQDARKYLEGVEDIQRARSLNLKKTDSIGGRWAVEDETKKGMEALERKFSGKFRRVIFDIPFGKEPGIMNRVYTAREVRNIDYQEGVGAKGGRLASRAA